MAEMDTWIEAIENSLERRGESVHRVARQAVMENGNEFCVVFHRDTEDVIEGGVEATPEQVERLKEMGVFEGDTG